MTTSQEHLNNIGNQWNLKTAGEKASLVANVLTAIASRQTSGSTCSVDLGIMTAQRDAALAARDTARTAATASAALNTTLSTQIDADIATLAALNATIAAGTVPADLQAERAAVVAMRAYYGV